MQTFNESLVYVGIMTIFLAVCSGSFPSLNQSLQIRNLFKTLIKEVGLEF